MCGNGVQEKDVERITVKGQERMRGSSFTDMQGNVPLCVDVREWSGLRRCHFYVVVPLFERCRKVEERE